MNRAALIACLALTAAMAAPARGCDLALVLAVDVSGSVDPGEYALQMRGLAAALRDPVVSEALVRGEAALMLVQWTGSTRQEATLDWTSIRGFAEIDDFARRVETAPRAWRSFSTAIGEALAYSMAQFASAPDCRRRLIDLSGDGTSNEGVAPAALRAALRAADIGVNALAIEGSEPDLTGYFFENVIRGEGAFVETANGFDDYPRAIRRKLRRELARQTADLRAVPQPVRASEADTP